MIRQIGTGLALACAMAVSTVAEPLYDGNADGFVTVAEMERARPDLSETDFIVLDDNRDGVLDTGEMHLYVERYRSPQAVSARQTAMVRN